MSEAITREELLGSKRPVTEVARALGFANPKPVYAACRKYDVPMVTIGKSAFVDPHLLMRALERPSETRPYRRRAKADA